MTGKQAIRQIDKTIAVIAKYYNISPMEILNGDYHYFIYQYNLAVEDEYQEALEEQKPPETIKRVESLFEAFGEPNVE